jgi:transposase
MSGLNRERRFSRDFKLAALQRMLAGENVSALCRDLGIARKLLYDWRERYRLGGVVALRERGRPTRAESEALRALGLGRPVFALEPADGLPPVKSDALLVAYRRIAELERKVGEQALDLDFFQGALQRIEGAQLEQDGAGATRSSPRSRR